MTTISAVVEGLREVAPAEQAVAPHLVSADRTVASRRSGREVAILVSIGLAEAVWCALLGYAAWALIF